MKLTILFHSTQTFLKEKKSEEQISEIFYPQNDLELA